MSAVSWLCREEGGDAKPQAKAASKASSNGVYMQLFRMGYDRKKGF